MRLNCKTVDLSMFFKFLFSFIFYLVLAPGYLVFLWNKIYGTMSFPQHLFKHLHWSCLESQSLLKSSKSALPHWVTYNMYLKIYQLISPPLTLEVKGDRTCIRDTRRHFFPAFFVRNSCTLCLKPTKSDTGGTQVCFDVIVFVLTK